MRNDKEGNGKATSEEALANLFAFMDDDPLRMDEKELDLYLAQAGIDFPTFDARLRKDFELAAKKGRLAEARERRKGYLARARKAYDLASMTLEEKKAEIQQRLGLVGGRMATVFNREYENAEDEEDIDGLLTALRDLDERVE